MKLYLLYETRYLDVGEGAEKVLVAAVLAGDISHAEWQFKLMKFSLEYGNEIIEIDSYDVTGFMFLMPEYLVDYYYSTRKE